MEYKETPFETFCCDPIELSIDETRKEFERLYYTCKNEETKEELIEIWNYIVNKDEIFR